MTIKSANGTAINETRRYLAQTYKNGYTYLDKLQNFDN